MWTRTKMRIMNPVSYTHLDGAPKAVKEGASKAEAEDIKAKLEAEGAKVTLK